MSNTDGQGKQYDENLDITEDNVEALINGLGTEGEPSPEDDDTDDKAEADSKKPDEGDKPEAEDKAKEADDKGEQDKPDDKPEERPVIKTRDGKHEIPYSVLERERREKGELQRQLDEIQRQQQALEQKKPEAPKDPGTGASTDTDEMSIDAIREEYGDEMAKIETDRRQQIADMEQRQKALEDELTASRKWREDQERKAQQSVVSEVNEAIDSIRELREWRENDDPLWAAAEALDTRLAQTPEWEGKPLRARFEAVVEKLTGRKPNQDTASNDKALDEKLAEQERSATTKPPSSLSDLPGGQPPDVSESETLDRMSSAQLEAKFNKMTPEQQEEYLARL